MSTSAVIAAIGSSLSLGATGRFNSSSLSNTNLAPSHTSRTLAWKTAMGGRETRPSRQGGGCSLREDEGLRRSSFLVVHCDVHRFFRHWYGHQLHRKLSASMVRYFFYLSTNNSEEVCPLGGLTLLVSFSVPMFISPVVNISLAILFAAFFLPIITSLYAILW
jgi:hypothetical protein